MNIFYEDAIVRRMEIPETRYALAADGTHIAYQVVGSGPTPLVFIPEWWSHLEEQWEEPQLAKFLLSLAAFTRLILFDKRGVGLSDPVPLDELPTLEQWMGDIRAVLDSEEVSRAAVWGQSGGGALSLLFSATYPERTQALILSNTSARVERAPDYPHGVPERLRESITANVRESWGTGAMLDSLAPSVATDRRFRRWYGRLQRLSASPGTAAAIHNMTHRVDVRDVLPVVRVPTLVMHRVDSRWFRVGHGRYLAERIEGARFVELPGDDHLLFLGEVDPVLDEAERFLTGELSSTSRNRVLATVLLTDIVNSTERAVELGDRRWKQVLEAHDHTVGRQIERFSGRLIESTGDGALATFDGPARAVRCARAIGDAVRALGIAVRAGVHTGEVEVRGDRISGVTVHVTARIMALASPQEILVSRTVRDLVAGSEIEFEGRGEQQLRGVAGKWELFAPSA